MEEKQDPLAHFFKDPQRLPGINRVWTAPGDKLEVPENLRRQTAVVETERGNFLLSDAHFAGTAQYATLKERIAALGIRDCKVVRNVDSGVLMAIYRLVEGKSSNIEAILDERNEPHALGLFREVMAVGLEERATDVHIMARRPFGKVCFRIDGEIRAWKSLPFEDLDMVCGYGYMKLAETGSRSHPTYSNRQIQSCMIPHSDEHHKIKLRYNSMDMLGGFDVVMRILHTEVADDKVLMPVDLGYAPSQARMMELATRMPIGAIFMAGVTGSGKTTTSKTLMMMPHNRALRKYYSVEDPVEYKMFGVSQHQVQRSADSADDLEANPYVPSMRGFPRMDPDTIMVGEARDKQSISMVKSMIQSGHQVICTVHGSSAINVFSRLASDEMGLPRDIMGSRSFISAIIFQTLIPKLCPHCKLPAPGHMSEDRLDLLAHKYQLDIAGIYVARDGGCEHCKSRLGSTGTRGQTVAAEIIMPDMKMLKMIREGKDLDAEAYWRGQRRTGFADDDMTGKTAFEHGLYKVSQGLVDPRAVEVFEPLETYEIIPI